MINFINSSETVFLYDVFVIIIMHLNSFSTIAINFMNKDRHGLTNVNLLPPALLYVPHA